MYFLSTHTPSLLLSADTLSFLFSLSLSLSLSDHRSEWRLGMLWTSLLCIIAAVSADYSADIWKPIVVGDTVSVMLVTVYKANSTSVVQFFDKVATDPTATVVFEMKLNIHLGIVEFNSQDASSVWGTPVVHNGYYGQLGFQSTTLINIVPTGYNVTFTFSGATVFYPVNQPFSAAKHIKLSGDIASTPMVPEISKMDVEDSLHYLSDNIMTLHRFSNDEMIIGSFIRFNFGYDQVEYFDQYYYEGEEPVTQPEGPQAIRIYGMNAVDEEQFRITIPKELSAVTPITISQKSSSGVGGFSTSSVFPTTSEVTGTPIMHIEKKLNELNNTVIAFGLSGEAVHSFPLDPLSPLNIAYIKVQGVKYDRYPAYLEMK